MEQTGLVSGVDGGKIPEGAGFGKGGEGAAVLSRGMGWGRCWLDWQGRAEREAASLLYQNVPEQARG